MKKFIFVLIALFLCFKINLLNASVKQKCFNLIDGQKISYNEDKGIYYCNQEIELHKDKTYTLIISKFFFDEEITTPHDLDETIIDNTFINSLNQESTLDIKIKYYSFGFFASEFISTDNGVLTLDNLKITGHSKDTILRNDIMLYEGNLEDVQGYTHYFSDADFSKVNDEITIFTDYDNPLRIADLKDSIKAYDNSDGELEVSIIEDNYTNDNSLEEKNVIFSATDKSGNQTNLTIKLKKVDLTKPVISGEDRMSWDNNNDDAPTIEDFIKNYSASDNFDGNITDKIYISESNLDTYYKGTTTVFRVVLAVSDTSGNTCSKCVYVDAVDYTPPILELKEVTVKLSEIGSLKNETIGGLVVESSYDNSHNVIYDVEVSENKNPFGFSGVYDVKVICSDPSGNKTEKSTKITVVDDIAPELYIKSFMLETTANKPYTIKETKEYIKDRLNQRGILFDNINLISCNYFGSEDTEGVYSVKYLYEYNGVVNYELADIIVKKSKVYFPWEYLILILPVGLSIALIICRRKKSIHKIS